MTEFRQARWADLDEMLNLIEKGFSETPNNSKNLNVGKEYRVLFSYLYSFKDWEPGLVYLAEEAGKLLALVGVFPQILSFSGINMPVWSISPVVTHPKYRDRGLAGQCLQFGIKDLKSKGIPAVFLWGLPTYYPKFGFVPVLPRYKTKLVCSRLMNSSAKSENGGFRNLGEADLDSISKLYNLGNPQMWLQPKRNLQWWQKRVVEMNIELADLKEISFPKKENFMVWENNFGKVAGYLYFTEQKEKQRVIINEAVAENRSTAINMLHTLIREHIYQEHVLYIQGTPDHYLNLAAYRLGGIHLNPAPLAGMVKVIDWPRFLNSLLPLLNERLQNILLQKKFNFRFQLEKSLLNLLGSNDRGLEMEFSGFPNSVGWEDNIRLTRLVFGLYDQIDLGQEDLELNKVLSAIFPKKYPFIWDANYLY